MLLPIFLVIQDLNLRLRPLMMIGRRASSLLLLLIVAIGPRGYRPSEGIVVVAVLLSGLLHLRVGLAIIDIFIEMIGPVEIGNQILLRLILIWYIRRAWRHIIILWQLLVA